MGRYTKKRHIKRANKLLEERYINEKEGVDDEEFLNQLNKLPIG